MSVSLRVHLTTRWQMADNGRARLDDFERRFSHVGAGAAGREIRTPLSRIETRPYDGGVDPAVANGSYWGLAEIYGAREEKWGGDSAGLTARPADGGYSRIFDELGTTPRTQGADVGRWPDLWDTGPVSAPGRASGVGDDDEVAWYSVALAVAGAAVIACWNLIRKYPLSAALWAAAIVMWVIPG